MSLISTTIPNLVNGVSQQPAALRLASQCQEQINGHSSVVEGLRKRPGTYFIAKLPDVDENSMLHTINRDLQERYVVVFSNGGVKVFDLEGNEQVVNYPDGTDYLASTNPQENFKALTVADYTFVLNKTVTVKRDTVKSPERPYEALVWVKQGAYGAKYEVTLDGYTASYEVPDGGEPSHSKNVATDFIAEQLRSALASNKGSTFQIERYGSTIYITQNNSAHFNVTHRDSLADQGMSTVAKITQRFSDLPNRAVDGFEVEITGDQSSSFDNYYVKYDTTDSAENSGVWKETIKGGEEIRLDAATMPHALVRLADGTFEFRKLNWRDRKVGDLDSNLFPTFVGRGINDIFFHRNRLGFVSGENLIFSRTGEYFDFFIGTATAILDDDPIDVGVSHTRVSILEHAVPFNETLLLFSGQTQFQLGAAEILTPETISVNQTTEYECSLKATPVGAGRYVYFAVNRGTYSGIREYYIDANTEAEDAEEVTGHVPKYIPGEISHLSATSNETMLAALTNKAPNEIFIYKFHWAGNEKLQSSWSRWSFDKECKVLSTSFIESRLFILTRRPDGVYLEYLNLEPGSTEEGWNIHVHLDSKLDETQVEVLFDEGDPDLLDDNKTVITLPYKAGVSEELSAVVAPGGARKAGKLLSFERDDAGASTVLTFDGDLRGQPLFIGKNYTFRYRMSTLTIKEEAAGGGQMTNDSGRIQMRNAAFSYNETGFFEVLVQPQGRGVFRYVFSGRVVGSLNNQIGEVSIEEGKFKFPVNSKNDRVNIEIHNTTFLPCFFLNAEWEAFYKTRSRRI